MLHEHEYSLQPQAPAPARGRGRQAPPGPSAGASIARRAWRDRAGVRGRAGPRSPRGGGRLLIPVRGRRPYSDVESIEENSYELEAALPPRAAHRRQWAAATIRLSRDPVQG